MDMIYYIFGIFGSLLILFVVTFVLSVLFSLLLDGGNDEFSFISKFKFNNCVGFSITIIPIHPTINAYTIRIVILSFINNPAKIDIYEKKKLIAVTDLLGKKVNLNKIYKYDVILHIYDDGSVERKVIFE